MARKRTWLEWLNPLSRLQRWFTFFAIAWFATASYLLYLAFTRTGVQLGLILANYLLATVACSLIAFVAYGLDKRRAMRDKPRISERTLHLLSACGGWPGAQLGRQVFRHKTLKLAFRIVFFLIVAAHLLFIVYGIFSGWWVNAVHALMTGRTST